MQSMRYGDAKNTTKRSEGVAPSAPLPEPSSASGPPDAPEDDGVCLSAESVRQAAVQGLTVQLDIGMEMAERLLHNAALDYDEPHKAVLAAARLFQASAHLGRAIGFLSGVESRRRLVVEHVEAPNAPPQVSNDSNSILEAWLLQALKGHAALLHTPGGREMIVSAVMAMLTREDGGGATGKPAAEQDERDAIEEASGTKAGRALPK